LPRKPIARLAVRSPIPAPRLRTFRRRRPACGVHKVRRVRSRTLNRPVNCLGLMEAFARFSSDSDGSNAIEEPRVGFRVRRVVYPVGGTSRHRLPPPRGPSPAPKARKTNCFRFDVGRRRGARVPRRNEHRACGSDLAQHGRDRIDQGAAICSRMGVPATGVGMRSGAADGLCELHR
jgi:hypothetical protein